MIGRNGRIRSLIEEISNCEMAIHGSTVLVIGDQDGVALAAPASEGIIRASEHSTVLHGLAQDRKRLKIQSRQLKACEDRGSRDSSKFDTLVPGLAQARRRRERRDKDSQVSPSDSDEVSEVMELADDESVTFEEE